MSRSQTPLVLVPTGFEYEHLFGKKPPPIGGMEQLELEGLVVQGALCGFGLVAAGTTASALFAKTGDGPCIVCGIAGSYDLARAPLESTVVATDVLCHGIGSGQGEGFQSSEALSFAQLPASPRRQPVFDRLDCLTPELEGQDGESITLGSVLSVTACSEGPGQRTEKLHRFPEALAEDMESFAIAMAATLVDRVPIVLRGISNEVGIRDKKKWRVRGALAKTRETLTRLLGTLDR